MRQPNVQGKSPSWRQKLAYDIGLFYEFFRATNSSTETQTHANNLINGFLNAAMYGTICEDGTDHLGLFWERMSQQRAKLLQSNLRVFLEFLNDFAPGNSLSKSKFTQMSNSAFSLELRKNNSLLFHLSKRNSKSHQLTPRVSPAPPVRTVKKFPRDKLVTLALEGCRLERRRDQTGKKLIDQFNINMMMSLSLLIGGGLRKSNLFHIWVDDLRVPQGKVYLYHPTEGVVSGARSKAVRRHGHLREVYGLVPRNTLPTSDKFHAGWKDLLIDDADRMCSEVYWCHPFWRDLFINCFVENRDHVRPDDCGHPYLFVSLADGTVGKPWTIWAFNEGWKAALKRIGMTTSASDGINPHGLRHAYGQQLRDLGLHPQFIQRAMHHKSPLSQMPYTAPHAEEINAALQAASKQVETQSWGRAILPDSLNQALARRDPAGVYRVWGNQLNFTKG